MLGSGYVTGGVSAATLSSSVLNSVTGGLNPGLGGPGLLNPTMATGASAGPADVTGIAGGPVSGAHAAAVSAASGPTPIPPALRTTMTGQFGFLPGGPNGGNDSGFRSPALRESGIPNSGFFNKGDRDPGALEPGIQVPEDLID
jgi:hypothetical protein